MLHFYFFLYGIYIHTHIVIEYRWLSVYLYTLREFRKWVIAFFPVKNTPKLINQQFKNGVKIVN